MQVDSEAVDVRLTELDPGLVWDAEFVVTGRAEDKNMQVPVVVNGDITSPDEALGTAIPRGYRTRSAR